MIIENLDFYKLYKDTYNGYLKCIEKEDNKFLYEEVNFDLRKAYVENEFVKVIFRGEIKESFEIEIRIKLFDFGNNYFGYYSHILNQDYEIIDNILFFE